MHERTVPNSGPDEALPTSPGEPAGAAPRHRSSWESLCTRLAEQATLLEGAEARAALAAVEVSDEEIGRLGAVSATHHTRFELLRTEAMLVVLIVWLPGQFSPAHDHGGSACIFRVLRGTATERRYQLARAGAVQLVDEDEFLAGAIVSCEGSDIHALGNGGHRADRLVTLHLYRPLPAMREYAIEPEAEA